MTYQQDKIKSTFRRAGAKLTLSSVYKSTVTARRGVFFQREKAMENKKNMTDDEKSYWRIYQCDVCGEERSVNYDHICERCDAESADLAETKLDAIRYSQNQHGGVK